MTAAPGCRRPLTRATSPRRRAVQAGRPALRTRRSSARARRHANRLDELRRIGAARDVTHYAVESGDMALLSTRWTMACAAVRERRRLPGTGPFGSRCDRAIPGGRYRPAWPIRGSAGGAGDERGHDVGRVPVEGRAAPVVTHRGARIGMRGGFLHVPQGTPASRAAVMNEWAGCGGRCAC
jgi:hypothetical protein